MRLFGTLLWFSAAAACAQDASVPRFESATLNSTSLNCTKAGIGVVKSPDATALSILIQAASKNDKPFLAVGPGFAKSANARCIIDVVFNRPLARVTSMAVDYRGAEDKWANTEAKVDISLGSQRHVFDYARGHMLDGAAGTDLKRFIVIDIPKGTRKIRVKVVGSSRAIDEVATALIGFESMDLCFVDPDRPEICGAPGIPNPRTNQ